MTSRSVIETATMPTPDPLAIEDILEGFSRITLSAPPVDTSPVMPHSAIDNISDSLDSVQLNTSPDIPSIVLPRSNSSRDGAVVSVPDKRDAHVASKRALQTLTRIEDHILLLESSLVAPSKAQLGSAEAELSRLRSVFSRVTRNTTLVLTRKEEIGRHLERISGRVCELRHLVPARTPSDEARRPISYDCGTSAFEMMK